MRTALVWLMAAGVLAMLGCQPQTADVDNTPVVIPAPDPPDPVPVDESSDGLKQHVESLIAATRAQDYGSVRSSGGDLLIPDHEAWFQSAFGPDVGAALSADYADSTSNFSDDFPGILRTHIAESRFQVVVSEETAPDTPSMVEPVTIYSAELVAPGQSTGAELGPFVYVDG
ncbi:MAG TPA: hypothetical protein QGH10_00045, partial [Armatimonadota bacterium]|nr:hypothetical protein [Armatimonadota bacterium]